MEEEVAALPGVTEVTFISQAEAWANTQEFYADRPWVLDGMTVRGVNDRLSVRVEAGSDQAAIVKLIRSIDDVESVTVLDDRYPPLALATPEGAADLMQLLWRLDVGTNGVAPGDAGESLLGIERPDGGAAARCDEHGDELAACVQVLPDGHRLDTVLRHDRWGWWVDHLAIDDAAVPEPPGWVPLDAATAAARMEDVPLIPATDLNVFLREDITAPQQATLVAHLEANPAVTSVTLETRDQALAIFRRVFPDLPDLDAVTAEELPVSLRVLLADPAAAWLLRDTFRHLTGAEDVRVAVPYLVPQTPALAADLLAAQWRTGELETLAAAIPGDQAPPLRARWHSAPHTPRTSPPVWPCCLCGRAA